MERGRARRMTRILDSKERISHRHDRPSAAFPTLLYACIIYRWRNECYVFGTVLIDEETITAYREQDASLVMICVICRARRTYALPKRWWNARTMIYRLEIKRSRLEIGVEMIKIVYKNINISFFQKTSNTLESKCLSIKIIYYSNWLFKISEFN